MMSSFDSFIDTTMEKQTFGPVFLKFMKPAANKLVKCGGKGYLSNKNDLLNDEEIVALWSSGQSGDTTPNKCSICSFIIVFTLGLGEQIAQRHVGMISLLKKTQMDMNFSRK